MREKDSSGFCFGERDKLHRLTSRKDSSYVPSPLGARHMSSLNELSPYSVPSPRAQKILRIKELVAQGRYETEEKIRVTAARIRDILERSD